MSFEDTDLIGILVSGDLSGCEELFDDDNAIDDDDWMW